MQLTTFQKQLPQGPRQALELQIWFVSVARRFEAFVRSTAQYSQFTVMTLLFLALSGLQAKELIHANN